MPRGIRITVARGRALPAHRIEEIVTWLSRPKRNDEEALAVLRAMHIEIRWWGPGGATLLGYDQIHQVPFIAQFDYEVPSMYERLRPPGAQLS
jgi:hypothetical protein